MIIILTVSDKYFSLNGINYAKIYQPLSQGVDSIGIYNIYDTRQQLISSTVYSDYEVEGLTYANQSDTIEAILKTIFDFNVTAEISTKTDKGGYVGSTQDLKNELDTKVFEGIDTYQTKVELDAVSPVPSDGTAAKVANDGTSANNGYYAVDGGVWVKDSDLYENAIDKNNTSKGITGKAAYDEYNTAKERDAINIFKPEGFVPKVSSELALTVDFILQSDGTLVANNFYHYVEITNNDSFVRYFYADWQKISGSYRNIAIFNSAGELIRSDTLEGYNVIPLLPTHKIIMCEHDSSSNSVKIYEATTYTDIKDLNEDAVKLKAERFEEWIDIVNTNIEDQRVVNARLAIKSLEVYMDASISSQDVGIYIFTTIPTSLNPTFNTNKFNISRYDGATRISYNLESTETKDGLTTMTVESSDGLFSAKAIIDWSLLPTTFELYDYDTLNIRINPNIFSPSARSAKKIKDIESYVDVFKTRKKILGIGTSIPAWGGSDDIDIENTLGYMYEAATANHYDIYNKSVGGSTLTTNVATPKALMATIAEKEAEFSAGVTAEVMETYRDYSFERRILPYLDGTIDSVDVIWFEHGHNDREKIAVEVASGLGTVDWEINELADRSTFAGAFSAMLYHIYKAKPDVKIIIGGYFDRWSASTSGNRYGADIYAMHKEIQEVYGLQYLPIWESVNMNYFHIPNTSTYISDFNTLYGTSYTTLWDDGSGNVTLFQFLALDGTHPHSDQSGKALQIFNSIYTKLLSKINM